MPRSVHGIIIDARAEKTSLHWPSAFRSHDNFGVLSFRLQPVQPKGITDTNWEAMCQFDCRHVLFYPPSAFVIAFGFVYRASISKFPLSRAIGEIDATCNCKPFTMKTYGFDIEDEKSAHRRELHQSEKLLSLLF